MVIFSLVMSWWFSGFPQIWKNPAIPPEVETAKADTATNNPTNNTGAGWTNPTNAYSDGSGAATQTSGGGANVYLDYGFNLSGNAITQVRVGTDAWSVSTSATISKNPTANTNGTYPWTNPGNGYTSNNSYATAVATIPTLRGSVGTMNHSAGTAITVALPGTRSANDIFILVASTIAGGSITITTDGSVTPWTPITGSPIDVTSGEKLYVWWGRYSSGSTGPTLTPGGDHIVGRIVGYYNCYADGNPIDVAATGSETTSDTSFSFATGLTTTYNNEMIITVCSTGNDPSFDTTQFSSWTGANLGTKTERMDNDVNEGGGGGFGLMEASLVANGAVGTVGATLAAASPKSYIAFALRSTTPNNLFDQIYGTFGFTNTSETITKVELGYEAYAGATGKLNFYTSTNGGSSWSSAHQTANLGTSDPNSYTYIDVTSDFSWTWTLLNDTNFKIKVESVWVSGTPTWYIDALAVRVTYNSLTNEQIRVAVSWDGGSSWSSNYDTNLTGTETTYWTDVTAATTWTPTKLNDSNFRVSVSSVTVGDTSTVNLDWIPVEVTYTTAIVSVSVSDGVVTYGFMPANTSKSTLPGELNDMQTATNNGDVIENFNIKGQDSANWELADTNGSDQYIHMFCNDTDNNCSSPPTNYTALNEDSYTTLDTNIAVSGTVDFQLRLTTPNPSTVFTQQQVNVTVQAIQAP